MKYILIIADGMADQKLQELGNQTPLQYAKTEAIDALAKRSEIGFVQTIPDGMEAGSDVAGLSIFGYEPQVYYTGRAPLEALGLQIPLEPQDIVYRCNLVTLSSEREYEKRRMIDHMGGEISTVHAKEIIKNLQNVFDRTAYQYYTETSYRHLLVWKHGKIEGLTPPHNILGEQIGNYLPEEEALLSMMKKSDQWLHEQPTGTANSIWFWGGGKRTNLPDFSQKYGKRGAMISAVAVMKGIAAGANLTNITVQGATGTVDTNYGEKAQRALKALIEEQYDFICIHIEAPDEASHRGDANGKIKAIEQIDQKIVKVLVKELDALKINARILILPDHETLVKTRKHTNAKVPYLLYDSRDRLEKNQAYNEEQGCFKQKLLSGTELIERLFSENKK